MANEFVARKGLVINNIDIEPSKSPYLLIVDQNGKVANYVSSEVLSNFFSRPVIELDARVNQEQGEFIVNLRFIQKQLDEFYLDY